MKRPKKTFKTFSTYLFTKSSTLRCKGKDAFRKGKLVKSESSGITGTLQKDITKQHAINRNIV